MEKEYHDLLIRLDTKVSGVCSKLEKIELKIDDTNERLLCNTKECNAKFVPRWVVLIIISCLLGLAATVTVNSISIHENKIKIEHNTNHIERMENVKAK